MLLFIGDGTTVLLVGAVFYPALSILPPVDDFLLVVGAPAVADLALLITRSISI